MQGPRVIVLGSGLAGAASALWLTRRGCRVTVVEREPRLGVHASGRGAGLIRQVLADPALAALTRRGAALLARPPGDLEPLYEVTGSVLLASGEQREPYRRAAEDAQAAGLGCRVLEPRDAELCGVRPAPDAIAIHTPTDGLATPAVVLEQLGRAAARAGAELVLDAEARLVARGDALRVEAGGRELAGDWIVNAAGAWAAELVAAAGGAALPLQNYRRHLLVAEGPAAATSWVWDVSRGVYVRPDAGGVMLCACDQDPRPPEDAAVDPAALDGLRAKLRRLAPGYAELPQRAAWAGLRGFVPDRRFVVGADPHWPRLVWATALGGHGLTSCLAVGELAAGAVFGEATPAALDPARYPAVEARS
ncbi:MAG: FAD-dependent oxidoreductase [Planctomycetota bacterium]